MNPWYIYIYIQCFWEDFNKPLDIPIFFGQKSKDGKLQNSKFCPPPVPKGEPRVVQNPTAEDFFGFFRVRECHDFSCLGSSKTKTRPKDEQNIFKETTSWIDSISMEFWHCIIAHHELRNAPQGADEPNIPQLIWGFSFTVFQNYVLFQLFFSCDFLELRTKITIPPLLKKGPCKKIPSWISTPPSALFFFFFAGLQRPGYCGHSRVDSAEDLLRDDVVPRRMAVGTVGVRWWWWRKNPEVWGSLGVGYGLKTGWFPWTWFWDLRVNLGWVFLLESNLLMDPSHWPRVQAYSKPYFRRSTRPATSPIEAQEKTVGFPRSRGSQRSFTGTGTGSSERKEELQALEFLGWFGWNGWYFPLGVVWSLKGWKMAVLVLYFKV